MMMGTHRLEAFLQQDERDAKCLGAELLQAHCCFAIRRSRLICKCTFVLHCKSMPLHKRAQKENSMVLLRQMAACVLLCKNSYIGLFTSDRVLAKPERRRRKGGEKKRKQVLSRMLLTGPT